MKFVSLPNLFKSFSLLGLSFAFSLQAQIETDSAQTEFFVDTFAVVNENRPHKYPSLLWQISGNGLKKPSYLYGTMHVSRKLVFRLTDSFFKALYSADVVALESDANKWIDEIAEEREGGFEFFFGNFYSGFGRSNNWYSTAFDFNLPDNDLYKNILRREPALADAMLYRESDRKRNFSEQTYLDMFIHQAGMKLGKQVTGLENYKVSREMVSKSRRPDPRDEKEKKPKKRPVNWYSDNIEEQIENAYRNGDLDLLDSLETITAPHKNFLRWMLWERNKVMVKSIDSIIKREGKILFAGVGAAHVGGDSGMVEMLRRMGYTVRPVNGEMDKWASEQKDKIDRMSFKHGLKPYLSPTEDFKAQFPGTPMDTRTGKSVEYFYPDMANGAYYSISALPYYGALRQYNSEKILEAIDSLLFENIPGKILMKKKLTHKGFPAIDIKSRTSLGDHQRYMILATPTNVWIVKMSGQGEFVKEKNGDNFIESFEVLESKEINWQLYSPPAGGYEIKWPTVVVRKRGKRDTIKTYLGHVDIDAADKTGNYYFLKRAFLNNSADIFEEDTFELSELGQSMIASFKGKKIKKELSKLGNLPCLDLSFYSETAKGYFHLKYVLQSTAFWLIGCKTANESKPKDFLNSFKFLPFQYHSDFKLQTDSVLWFTTKTIDIPNYGKPTTKSNPDDYNYFGYNRRDYLPTKDTLNIQYQYENKNYSYSDMEGVGVNRILLNAFAEELVIDTILNGIKREAKRNSHILHTLKQEKIANNFNQITWILTDTNSSRAYFQRFIFRNRLMYKLSTGYDTLSGLMPFEKMFIDNFVPFDTFKQPCMTKERAWDSLFIGIFNSDSLIKRNMREQYNSRYFNRKENNEKYLDKLFEIIKKVNKNEEKNLEQSTYNSIYNHISSIPSQRTIDFLKSEYYAAGDTASKQLDVLSSLAWHKKPNSTQAFMELLLDETPLSNSNSSSNDIFYTYFDSVKYAKPLLPKIFDLLRYKEYKQHILNLTIKMLDSGIISSADYANQKQSFLLDFRDEFKRQRAQNTNTPSYNYRYYDQDNSENEENKQYADDQEEYYSRPYEKKSDNLISYNYDYGYRYGGSSAWFGSAGNVLNQYSLPQHFQSLPTLKTFFQSKKLDHYLPGRSGGYGEYGNYEQNNGDALTDYARLLVPFYHEPEIKRRMDKVWNTKIRVEKFNWLQFYIKYNLPTPDTLVNYFYSRKDYTYSLASCFDAVKKFDSIPTKLKNEEKNSAELFLYDRNISQWDSIVFVEKKNMEFHGKKGTAYVYKHHYKRGFETDWYLDFMWFEKVKSNTKSSLITPYYYIINRKMEEGKNVTEQVNSICEEIYKYKRSRWSPPNRNNYNNRYGYEMDY